MNYGDVHRMSNDYFINTQRGLHCIELVGELLIKEEAFLALLNEHGEEDSERVRAVKYRIGQMKYALSGSSNDRPNLDYKRCQYHKL